MATELRDAEDGRHLIIYTENEGVRKRLKKFKEFVFENPYRMADKLVAADVWLSYESCTRESLVRALSVATE